jgi:hypothetical protein
MVNLTEEERRRRRIALGLPPDRDATLEELKALGPLREPPPPREEPVAQGLTPEQRRQLRLDRGLPPDRDATLDELKGFAQRELERDPGGQRGPGAAGFLNPIQAFQEGIVEPGAALLTEGAQRVIPGEQEIQRRTRERREAGEGFLGARTEAFRESDLPFGVKGAIELAADPFNVFALGPLAGLGRKALTRGATQVARKAVAPARPARGGLKIGDEVVFAGPDGTPQVGKVSAETVIEKGTAPNIETVRALTVRDASGRTVTLEEGLFTPRAGGIERLTEGPIPQVRVAGIVPTRGRELGRGTYFSTDREIAQGFAEGRAPFAGNVTPRPRTGTEVVSRFSVPKNTKIFSRDNVLNPGLLRKLQQNPKFAQEWRENWTRAPASRNNLWAAAEEARILPELQSLLEAQGFKGARHSQGQGIFDYAIWDQSIISQKPGGIELFRGAPAQIADAPTTARAGDLTGEVIPSSEARGITRYEQSVQRRQVEGGIQEGPLDIFAVESQQRGRGFFEGLSETRRTHKFGAAVEVKDPSFYVDPSNKLYLAADDSAGIAVTPDGDVVSVFKVPGSTQNINPILSQASKVGRTLDAYDVDEVLPNLYANHGFRPAARVRFNKEFAPEDWPFDIAGEPDIVLMVRDPDGLTGLPNPPTRDAGGYAAVKEGIPIFDDWGEAVAHRQQFLDRLPARAAGDAPTPAPRPVPTTGTAALTEPQAFTPPGDIANNVIGLRPIKSGLTRQEELANVVRRTLGRVGIKVVPDQPQATAALRERARVKPIIESRSNVFSAVNKSRVRDAFQVDKQGRIPALAGLDPGVPGAPTIQDVAARFPAYEAALTLKQRAAMEALRQDAGSFKSLLDEVGVEIGSRTDVVEGGFYLPRGNAALEGLADEPSGLIISRGRGVGRGPERPALFESQAQGIEAGFEYMEFGEALNTYARYAGNRSTEQHLANFFTNLVDPETGILLGRTAGDRIDPVLRAQVQSFRAKITGRIQTLRRQKARGGAEEQALKDINRFADKADAQRMRAAERLSKRVQKGNTNDLTMDLIERELNVLDRMTARLDRVAGRAGERATRTATRETATRESIIRLRGELQALKGKWELAKRRAALVPRGEAVIDLPGLQQHSFPEAIANAANKLLIDEGTIRGRGAQLDRTINAVNDLYRGLNATADNSAIGIQGLLGAANDQSAYAAALRVNMRSWRDPEVLGRFLVEFDTKAAGRLSSGEWAKEGLRVGGEATEFELKGAIQQIPGVGGVIRASNRAFGFFGDSLRLAWADDELKRLLRSRSLDEIRASGDTARIARAINRTTGWTTTRFGGDVGERVLFAARFFQSRLETLVQGAAGLRPGANLEQRIARNSLLKLMGIGTMLTVGINELSGRDTDFRLTVNGRANSNFMRIRFAGRDWSLFGTWDSLLKVFVASAQGKPQDAFLGMASGVVTMGKDLLFNEDFIGRSVRDSPQELAEFLLRSFTPFATEELPEAGRQLAAGKILEAGALIGGEAIGAKSAPLSFIDVANDVTRELGLGERYRELEPYQKGDVDTSPSVEKVAGQRPSRGVFETLDGIDTEHDNFVNGLVEATKKDITVPETGDRFRRGSRQWVNLILGQFFDVESGRFNQKDGARAEAGVEFRDPDTQLGQDLERWYGLIGQIREEFGVLPPGALTARREALERELGPERFRALIRNTFLNPVPPEISRLFSKTTRRWRDLAERERDRHRKNPLPVRETIEARPIEAPAIEELQVPGGVPAGAIF